MKDKTTGSVVTVKRAIKTLKGAADDVTKAMFIRECKLMVKLGKHRNICRMTGAAMQQVPWLRIIELVAVASGKAAAKAGSTMASMRATPRSLASGQPNKNTSTSRSTAPPGSSCASKKRREKKEPKI